MPVRLRTALLAASAGALLVAPAALADDVPTVMAELSPGAGEADARALAARTGLELREYLPQIDWAILDLPAGTAGADARERLRHDPAVFRVDSMAPGETLTPQFSPRDTIFLSSGLVNGADWKWHWVTTNFPAAWDISRGAAGVRVAVIDSEFDTEHADLKTKFATGRNFDSGTPEFNTTNVRAALQDGGRDLGSLHGTHVAGLVGAATDNGNGVPGACFDCTVVPYKVGTNGVTGGAPNLDSKFVADLTSALVAAGDGDAAVVNMSLGTRRDHAPLRDAVAYARARGKTIVAAAGNFQLQFPGVPVYPGAYPGVIAVAATRPDDSIAAFSQNGDFVDIAAPGDGVLSTWDSRVPPGADPSVAPTHGQGFRALSGTSMASPIVAGLAALVKTVRPDLTPDEVEGVITGSAVDLGATGRDPVFGAGRIDAFRALQAAQAYRRPVTPPPGGGAAARRSARVLYSCRIGARTVTPGRRTPHRTARAGVRLVCTGRTVPALRGVRLDIQRYSARTRSWTVIGRDRTNDRGRFGFVRRLRTSGNWTVRVAYAGNAAFAPTASLATRVAVGR
jgi:subtilisin family serine protease